VPGREHRHRYADRWHLGLSATPERLDGRGLDDRFQALVLGPTVRQLIDLGHLADYRLFSIPGADLDNLHTRMGEFVSREAEEAMTRSAVMGDIVGHWQRHAQGRLTIGFAPTVSGSERLVSEFQAAGIPSAHLDAKTPRDERRDTLRRLADRELAVVWNVGLFGEGYDLSANSGKDARIECVIDAAPTQAVGAWMQRCGRALRPGDQAIILDHAGNTLRHGPPCLVRAWTLKGREAGQKAEGEQTEVLGRMCPECYLYCPHDARVCPGCGHIFEARKRSRVEIDGELAEMDIDAMIKRRERLSDQGRARTVQELTKVGIARGYPNPHAWAQRVFNARKMKVERERVEAFLLESGKTWPLADLQSIGMDRGFAKKWAAEMYERLERVVLERAQSQLRQRGMSV
jgi:superfamily II DNA or RNA helicase